MNPSWMVRVYREQFTEPVSALAWFDEELAEFLGGIARKSGPGTLVELIDPHGTVVASEAAGK